MPTLLKRVLIAAVAILGLFYGSVREARAGVVEKTQYPNCRNLPVIKNLTGLQALSTCEETAPAKDLTKREVRKLAATAKSLEDHLAIARFYRAEADGWDAQAASYEEAVARLGEGPAVKNLAAPTTAGRFGFFAHEFRENAKTDRALAGSHEKMARAALASLR